MNARRLKYLCAYTLPGVVLFSLHSNGWWTFSALTFLFVIIPIFELFAKTNSLNLGPGEEEMAREDPFYDYLLYGLVPIQFMILWTFFIRVSQQSLEAYEIIGLISAFGMSCGMAINAAHELGHRRTVHERIMSKILLMTSLYMHFYIEHNRGHHKNVGTDIDPASAKHGESIYSFYLRTLSGSWLSAWTLERDRLFKAKGPVWSWHNEMVRFQVFQLIFILSIGMAFGFPVLLYFTFSALMGILLLESVNYIEHYGLSRRKKDKGYERVLPVHSWNSNHPVGRLILLELARHSDHHFRADRKYQILRHFDESPQMPTGYPGMILLALIPPLWFHVMHRTLANFKQTSYGAQLAH